MIGAFHAAFDLERLLVCLALDRDHPVLRQAPVPVLVFHQPFFRPVQRVLLTTDLSELSGGIHDRGLDLVEELRALGVTAFAEAADLADPDAADGLFERVHAERLGRAGRFTRLDDREVERVLRRAARYRARLGWSLNRVAQRLAVRTGRSPEGVRRLLRRADRARGGRAEALFPEPGPPTQRERMLAVRAMARGIEPALLARRAGRRKSAVLRAWHEGRADLLRSLQLPAGGAPDPGTKPDDNRFTPVVLVRDSPVASSR